jgi:hypothetical protein
MAQPMILVVAYPEFGSQYFISESFQQLQGRNGAGSVPTAAFVSHSRDREPHSCLLCCAVASSRDGK